MRLQTRYEGGYKAVDPALLPKDNYERVHLEFERDATEELHSDTFDVKLPANSHLSTVMYLERTIDFQIQHYNGTPINVNLDLPTSGAGSFPSSRRRITIDSPGFSLQNNMERMEQNFQFCSVIERPHEWVPVYTHMYPKSLDRLVHASGRVFREQIADHYYISRNKMKRYVPLVKDVNILHEGTHDLDIYKSHGLDTVGLAPFPAIPAVDNAPGPPEGGLFRAVTSYDAERDRENHERYEQIVSDLLDIHDDRKFDTSTILGEYMEYRNENPDFEFDGDLSFNGQDELELLTDKQNFVELYGIISRFFFESVEEDKNYHYTEPGTYLMLVRVLQNYPDVFVDPTNTTQYLFYRNDNNSEFTQFKTHVNVGKQIAENVLVFMTPTNADPTQSVLNTYFTADGGYSHEDTDEKREAITDLTNAQLADAIDELFKQHRILTLEAIFEGKMGFGSGANEAEQARRVAILGESDNEYANWNDIYDNYLLPFKNYIEYIENNAQFDNTGDVAIPLRGDDGFPLLNTRHSIFRHTFYEPIVGGLCKPSMNTDYGCWKNVGQIIPRIERFILRAQYLDKLGARLFELNELNNQFINCRLKVFKIHDSRLHTTHYRNILKPQVSLVLHDFEHIILQKQFTCGAANQTPTFEFEFSFRTNNEPLVVFFYTKRSDDRIDSLRRIPKNLSTGPAITQMVLRNRTRSKIFDYTRRNSRPRLQQLTQDIFPEYCTMFEDEGGVLAIPYCAIPKSAYQSAFDERLTGKVTLELSRFGELYSHNFTYDFCVLLMYKDKYLALNQNDIKRVYDV